MHFTDLVALAGIEEDALRNRGLAGVNMRHDAKVAVVLEFVFAGHDLAPDPFVFYQR